MLSPRSSGMCQMFASPKPRNWPGDWEASFADRIFFANSGTEAIEASIKAVRGYQTAVGKPERHRIIGMSDSFHGRTIAAVAASGNPSYVQNFAPTDHGFDHIAWETWRLSMPPLLTIPRSYCRNRAG